jgi:hypothetical protein
MSTNVAPLAQVFHTPDVIQAKLLKIINVFLVYPKTRVATTSQLI